MKKYVIILSLFIWSCNIGTVPPPSPLLPVPTQSQLDWHDKEVYAFVHYTVNAFTDKEWGYGDENPNVFNPTDFDADQWAKVLKEAGFKGAILTAKHHDGFCLWPSKYTEHSVKNSAWKDGKGDIVGDFKAACDRHGLEFGVYLSPWDRNHADYASPSYVDYYQNQLTELLSSYGPMFEVWLDGANGGDGYYGGASEKRQINKVNYYRFPETYKIIHDFNPKTTIFGPAWSNPDVRWCGNEDGLAGKTNWNMMQQDSVTLLGNDRIKYLNQGCEDGTAWMPAEVDVSIRPGWFYHASEDSLVKTPDELFEIYLNSVGRGSNLLLNVAPDKRGLIPEMDIQALLSWRKKIDETFSNNLAAEAKVNVDSYRGKSNQHAASNLTDGNPETYWATDDPVTSGSIEFKFETPKQVQYVLIQEFIALGQRVKSFNIEVFKNGQWQQVASATTIGHKRIVPLEPIETDRMRINITGSKACPVISNVEVY